MVSLTMMPPSLSSEGNRLLAAGMVKEAIASFESALKSDPKDARCLLGLAKAHLAAGATDPALKALERLLEVKPDHLEGRSHRGLILARRGDPKGAEEMDAVTKDRRAGFEEHFNYGLYLAEAKQDDKAQREFEAAARIEGRDPRPYLQLGAIAVRRKDNVAAINQLVKATQFSGPQDAMPWVALARVYRSAGQGAQAASTFLEAVGRRREDEALSEEAFKACMESGELDSALKIVLMARERRPDDPRLQQWQEEVTAKLKAGGGKKAGAKRYEEGEAGHIDVDKEMERANQLLQRNPPTPPHVAKEVEQILDRVLRVKPDHADAVSLTGLCRYLQGDWDQAEALAKKALDLAEKAKIKVWKENAQLLLKNLEAAKKKKGAAKPAPGKAAPAAPPAKPKK
jgi:tetratricopeptide (TPR) repeat protein